MEHRDEVFLGLARKKGFKKSVIPVDPRHFENYLTKKIQEFTGVAIEVSPEIQRERLEFVWPSQVPQDHTGLLAFAQYGLKGSSLMWKVKQMVRFGLDVEDAHNEIWSKLLETDLHIKFVKSGPNRMGPELTVDEAKAYLGISDAAWETIQAEPEWACTPLESGNVLTDEIRRMDEAQGLIQVRGLRYLPDHAVSEEALMNYLRVSATHRLMNLNRTLKRRFNRDTTLGDGSALTKTSTGLYRVSRVDDCESAWEASVPSTEPSSDVKVDIYNLAHNLGLGPDDPELFVTVREYGLAISDYCRENEVEVDEDMRFQIICTMSEGHSIEQAFRKHVFFPRSVLYPAPKANPQYLS